MVKQIVAVTVRDGDRQGGAPVLAAAPGIAADVDGLAIDLPVADAVYEQLGRRPARSAPWHAVVHVWTPDGRGVEAVVGAVATVATSTDAWTVDPHVVWPYERSWPDGVETPGVKQISFVACPDAVPPPDFEQRYHHHREVAAVEHRDTWQYAQNLVRRAHTTDATRRFAAVSEMWFRSEDDLVHRYYSTPDSKARLHADTVQFIDSERTTWMLVAEHWVRSLPTFEESHRG